jgi:hypothetical protein
MTEEEVARLKSKLISEAKKRFPNDKTRQQAYVFGTLRRLGWKPRSS